jgi:signal transduction histidine kinase/CheY-like chemotaxis protein
MSKLDPSEPTNSLTMRVGQSFFETDIASNRTLQLLLVFAITVLMWFYFLPTRDHNPNINLVLSAICAALLPLCNHKKYHIFVMYSIGLVAAGITIYESFFYGGINAVVLAWLPIMPLAALVVGGLSFGLSWLLIVVVLLFAMFMLTLLGIVSPEITFNKQNTLIIFSEWFFCLLAVYIILFYYNHFTNRLIKELETENNAVNEAQLKLKKTQSHKDEFIASVGHELRTPIGAIIGINDLLYERLRHRPVEANAVQQVRYSTLQLLSLINNVLDFSQLQANKMHLRPSWSDPSNLMDDIANVYSNNKSYDYLNIKVISRLPKNNLYWIDAKRFNQVVLNLTENAIQFAKSEIALHMAYQAINNALVLEIRDDGNGVSPSKLKSLFNRFENFSKETNTTRQGAGLGLVICKMLLDIQQGSIGYRRENNQTIFYVEWPMEKPPIDQPSPYQHIIPLIDSFKILVVDDYPVNRMIIEKQLYKAFPKSHVSMASSAKEAMELLKQSSFDLILLDFNMPDMSGYEFSEWVRTKHESYKKTIIAGLTASDSESDFKRAMESGMDFVLSKPLNMSFLLNGIQTVLTKAESNDS